MEHLVDAPGCLSVTSFIAVSFRPCDLAYRGSCMERL